jgi:hypothetical protein
VSDWPDELAADWISFNGVMHERLAAVHRSMDDWEVDFLAALERHELGNSVDKPPTTWA